SYIADLTSALGHSYTTKTIAPTYAAKGYMLHTCSICGDSYKDNYTAKKTVSTVSVKSDYTSTTSAVRINWTKVSGATGYRIYRYNTSTKTWEKVKTIKNGSTTTYKQTGLKAGTTYKYKVKAYVKYNGTNYWSTSYSSTIKTSTKPSQVTIKSASKSKTAARINWNKVTGANGYQVQRYNSTTKKWVTVKTIKSGTTLTYKQTGLKKNTVYKYRVRAYRIINGKRVYGAWSESKKVTTKS
ncbi:MAG: fibronectin type III domain-containing protein, partial [Ruminococcus sp.]|nr:fibronectin type III domain-containing protein [Ruminococcus sp.]